MSLILGPKQIFSGLNTALFGILTGFDHSYPSLMKLILRLSRTKMVKSTLNYIRWSRHRVSEGFETWVGLWNSCTGGTRFCSLSHPPLPVVPQCRNIIKEYIVYLQTEFGKKVILPTDKPGQDINSVPIKAKPSGVSITPFPDLQKLFNSSCFWARGINRVQSTSQLATSEVFYIY